jgi:hypothetical protein
MEGVRFPTDAYVATIMKCIDVSAHNRVTAVQANISTKWIAPKCVCKQHCHALHQHVYFMTYLIALG